MMRQTRLHCSRASSSVLRTVNVRTSAVQGRPHLAVDHKLCSSSVLSGPWSPCPSRQGNRPGSSTSISFNSSGTTSASSSAPTSPSPVASSDVSAFLDSLLAGLSTLQDSIHSVPLKAEEQNSLSTLLQHPQAVKGTEMYLNIRHYAAQGRDALESHIMHWLDQATTRHEPLEVVEGAMLLLEQLSLQGRESSDQLSRLSQRAVSGRWQMVVTTEGGWPSRLQYIPVLEYMEFLPDDTHFTIETKLGPLYTTFTGNMQWLGLDRMSYLVDHVKVDSLLGSVTLPAPFPDNELLFFSVAGDTACARSRSGGLILLVRPL